MGELIDGYFRLKQYAFDFADKTKNGKFVNLDFGQLVELSTVDMYLRKILLKMTIDLEHYLKVELVNKCQSNSADDGYEVVADFLSKNVDVKNSLFYANNIALYGPDVLSEYKNNLAVWNIVELLGFYDFVTFYIFYHQYFKIPCEKTFRLDCVRRLRNSAAHNSCMIASLVSVPNFNFDMDLCFELISANLGIGQNVISSSMKVPVLNDFAVMLYVYNKKISSENIKNKTMEELAQFFDGRMVRHKEYFLENSIIKNAYTFARKVVEYYK